MSECVVWNGYIHPKGYGYLGRHTLAHRDAYEKARGPIPEGMTIDHLCRNRACVNPDHLEVVTRGANVLRGESITGMNARKEHCDSGHPFTADNTYAWRGERHCRACRIAWRWSEVT